MAVWCLQDRLNLDTRNETDQGPGKTVIPFNTNGGYGVGSSFQDVSDLATGARIREGFSVRGGLERDGIYLAIEGDRREEVRSQVRVWLKRIGLL